MTQQTSIEQINTSENGVYIVQDGIITPLKPKPFGQDTIIWHNGQVLDVERAERIRIKNKIIVLTENRWTLIVVGNYVSSISVLLFYIE